MTKITGKFILEKNEHFKEYLIATGVPEERAKQVDQLRPLFEVSVDDDKILLTSNTGATNSTSILILGKEVDEPIPTITTLKTLTSEKLNIPEARRIYKRLENQV